MERFQPTFLGLRPQIGHHLRHGYDLHPGLLQRATAVWLHQFAEVSQVREPDLASLAANRFSSCSPVACQLDEASQGARRMTGGLDAVEGRGAAALLDMAQDRAPHVEEFTAFLLEERGQELSRVQPVRVLAANDQAQPLPVVETL